VLPASLFAALEQRGGALPGRMSLPLGVPRRAFSYDDALEDTAPMTPPPADLCANVLWKQPVIPERKYQELAKVRAAQHGRGCGSGPGLHPG